MAPERLLVERISKDTPPSFIYTPNNGTSSLVMQRITFAVVVFVITGLCGPIVGIAVHGAPRNDFVDDVVFLLWPTGPIGVIEASVGPTLAAVCSVGSNVLLLAVFGLIAGMVARQRLWLVCAYCLLSGLILVVALWGSGFSAAHFSWFALIIALAFYAIPFWVVAQKYNQQIVQQAL